LVLQKAATTADKKAENMVAMMDKHMVVMMDENMAAHLVDN